MIYLVTRSPHYYASAGTYDWRLVTTDLEKATKFLESFEIDTYEDAYLIAIDPVSGGFQTITTRDGGG
jgi:hypothetical protein